MTNTKTIEYNKKIYDDSQNIAESKRINITANIYKAIMLLYLFVSFITILFTIKNSFFNQKNFSDLKIIFDFSSKEYEGWNWLIIFRILIISFIYFYPLLKGFININKNKEHIKIYSIWFTLYLVLSLVGFSLFHLVHVSDTTNVKNLLYALIPILLVDISYTLFNYFIKRRLFPIVFSSKTPLIIDIVSRITLCALTITVFMFWIGENPSGEALFNNKFYNWLHQLFNTKSITNLLIITSLSLIIGLLLTGLKIYSIYEIIYRQYDFVNFKSRISFYLTTLSAILIWLLSLFSLKIPTNNYFRPEEINYLGLLYGISNILIASLFAFLVITNFFNKKIVLNSNLLNVLYLAFFQLISWTIFLMSSFAKYSSIVNLINLFLTIFSSVTMFFIYYKKNKILNYLNLYFVGINITIIVVISFIFGLNQVLLSESNKAFYIINSHLSLMQILTIITVFFQLAFITIVTIYIFKTIIKISKVENKEKVEAKNEKIKQTK
ncbi:hypothetical protein LAD74_00535 [Mycoplasma sp. U97]|uniref:MSC_0624 family F1-like ATPase-associated membrane protein n=1 Tax=Mycoplasma tauri TaxID=547987 RepID=UPI001CC01C49|nr:hypothetical protein [Mycoplasma tauri]MBZ4212485.1 hypothetical protein [Mycoplasma tauri]